jgi:hypothetical protein
LQQRAHPAILEAILEAAIAAIFGRRLITPPQNHAPQKLILDLSGAGRGVESPITSPRPDWIRSKDRPIEA